jgi:hypothetical protein
MTTNEKKRFSFTCTYEFLEYMMNGGRDSYSEKLPTGASLMLNFDGMHSLLHVIIEEEPLEVVLAE